MSGYRGKIHHAQGQKRSIMCAYREKECKVIVVRMHIDSFPLEIKTIGHENIYSSQHCIHFILPTETWNFIHNYRSCPILDDYKNGIIGISLSISHFLPKGATSCSRLLINFKYNNYIQDKKPISAKWKMDVMGTQ